MTDKNFTEASPDLTKLEREMDEATLEFWESIEAKELANSRYYLAEHRMRSAKAAYLRAKLGGTNL